MSVGDPGRKCIVVCGPTASGKSAVADAISSSFETYAIVVDSMQVYRGLSVITNQDRGRYAHLRGFVPLSERWTVARHRDSVLAIVDADERGGSGARPELPKDTPIILDAGTGMYLNAILFDVDLAPPVPSRTRRVAEGLARGSVNERRAVREIELGMSGVSRAGSIWEGTPRFDTQVIYLRPDRGHLDDRIRKRSALISHYGIEEAHRIRESLDAGEDMNESVLSSVGVRELLSVLRGEMGHEQAMERIETRTRQLSRRQMTWFDKLARILPSKGVRVTVRDDVGESSKLE